MENLDKYPPIFTRESLADYVEFACTIGRLERENERLMALAKKLEHQEK